MHIYDVLNAFIVLLCIYFYLVGLGILCHLFHFCVLLSLSDFDMFDCIVFCDMLVALVSLRHLFENKLNANTNLIVNSTKNSCGYRKIHVPLQYCVLMELLYCVA